MSHFISLRKNKPQMNTSICMTESLCCPPETIITLSVNCWLDPNTKQEDFKN